MNDDDFRHQDDDVSDRTNDGPVQNGARAVSEGIRTGAGAIWEDAEDYRHGKEQGPSKLGDAAGMNSIPAVRREASGKMIKTHEYPTKDSYAEGGTVQPQEQTLMGAPRQQRDTTGAAVDPMISTESGGTESGDASPSMSFAEGGAIPDDGSDDATLGGGGDSSDPGDGASTGAEPDPTTTAFSSALKAVNAGLMYGRQKHGLPTEDSNSGIPQDGGDTSDSGGDTGGDAEMSFAEGGSVSEDDMVREYGPPAGDDGTGAEHPPISSDNTDQTAEPYQAADATPPGSPGDDNSGAAPVVSTPGQPDDNSGAAPVVGAQPQQPGQQAQQTPLAYLMGADGVAPQVLDHYKADTQGTEADRNLQAVDKAHQDGGDQGAWGVIQALRQKFDRFMNHGRAAAAAGDMPNAAQSATKAMDNLPDGQNVQFAPTRDGLVAKVGDNQVPLSNAAAQAFMNTGKLGQFDGLLENGVHTALKAAARAPAPQPQAPQPAGGQPAPAQAQPAPAGDIHSRFAGQANAVGQHARLTGQADAIGRPGGVGANTTNEDYYRGQPLSPQEKTHGGLARSPEGYLGLRDNVTWGKNVKSENDRAVTLGHDVTLLRASPKYREAHPESYKRGILTPDGGDPASTRTTQWRDFDKSGGRSPVTAEDTTQKRGASDRFPSPQYDAQHKDDKSVGTAPQNDVRVMYPNDRTKTYRDGNLINDTGGGGGKGRGDRGGNNGQAGIEREKIRQDALTARENTRHEHNLERDTKRNNWRDDMEQRKAMAAIDKMERGSSDKRMQEAAKMARNAISNPNFLMQTDEQRDAIYKKFGIDKMMQDGQHTAPPAQGGGQPQQAPQQAPRPQQPASNPPGTKMYNGKLYKRGPNGEAVEVTQ